MVPVRKIIFLICLLALPISGHAQDLRHSLFTEADQALQAAKEARADILAPKNYGQALKYYQKAEESLGKKKDIKEIQVDLRKATEYLNAAIEATSLAEVMFAATIQARGDALSANAPDHASRYWGEAEKKFAEAAKDLEEGDADNGKKKGIEAEKQYRTAELNAIKSAYLDEARNLLKDVNNLDADNHAPITYKLAKDLLSQAEEALEKNRYDTDMPRNLAKQARQEARHAIYLTKAVQELEREKTTTEELILQSEKQLVQIADVIDINPEFDNGSDRVVREISDRIKSGQNENQVLLQELSEHKLRIMALEEQLGGISDERVAMEARLQTSARTREQLAKIESLFTSDEARIMREGNMIIIRLIGLNFQVGKSTIDPNHFGLLTKVQDAIVTIPDCRVRIEGHTDSHGTDSVNLRLSQERADAVRQYLMANMRRSPESFEAVGYGETRPIANNETEAGRTKNRRIDIVLVPGEQN